MRYLAFFLLAATTLDFRVIDLRGRKASGANVEAGEPDADGWRKLSLTKSKPGAAILWPYDLMVKEPDGPAPIPVIVDDPNLPGDAHVAASALLRNESCGASAFPNAIDAFSKGVAALCAGNYADAVGPLDLALKERERQLTRFPSEIYPAAMLYGRALLGAGKFDPAAVAFLKALQQRPSDNAAKQLRAEALTKAGKPEAALPQ